MPQPCGATFLLVATVVTLTLGVSSALECYACAGINGSACASADVDDIKVVKCGNFPGEPFQCMTTFVSFHGYDELWARACFFREEDMECESVTEHGWRRCCDDDFCNIHVKHNAEADGAASRNGPGLPILVSWAVLCTAMLLPTVAPTESQNP